MHAFWIVVAVVFLHAGTVKAVQCGHRSCAERCCFFDGNECCRSSSTNQVPNIPSWFNLWYVWFGIFVGIVLTGMCCTCCACCRRHYNSQPGNTEGVSSISAVSGTMSHSSNFHHTSHMHTFSPTHSSSHMMRPI